MAAQFYEDGGHLFDFFAGIEYSLSHPGELIPLNDDFARCELCGQLFRPHRDEHSHKLEVH